MSEQPLVSVILPTFNRAAKLSTAVESVLRQSYKRLELIVVDDGSTDGTEQTVAAIDDARVRYERLDSNRGASAARNRGLELARGDYIAFQDSDDRWYRDKLATQLDCLRNASSSVGVCVCSHRLFKEGKTFEIVHTGGEVSGDEVVGRLLAGAAYGTQTLLVKKDTITDIGGFDETLPRRQDYELSLRIAERWAFVYVPVVLVELHYSEDSISLDAASFLDATEKIRDKHAAVFRRHRRGHSFQMYETGKQLAFAGQRRPALSYTAKALRLDPLNWRAGILLGTLLTGTVSLARRIKG